MTDRLRARVGPREPASVEEILSTERPPRLVLRFALYTAVGLAFAAASVLLFVRHVERGRTERAATFQAQVVARAVSDRLRPTDFEGTLTARRQAALRKLLGRDILGKEVLRVELVGDDGVVRHSSDPKRVGDAVHDRTLVRGALEGATVSDMTRVETPGGRSLDVLEAFSPIAFGNRGAGVIVVSQDYAPIARAEQRAVLPVVLVFELVLLGLWVSLFPILGRVTRRLRRQIDTIRHQALHDALTCLPNRSLFRARLEEALAAGNDSRLSVMILDLDRFKEVNDTLGHGHGDRLLQELGQRLPTVLRSGELVARLGGDEFGVLSSEATDPAAAVALAERLRATLAAPFELGGVSIEVQASVGIALAPDHGRDAETLLRHADTAMYAAKPGGAPQLYLPEHDSGSPERLALAGDLRRALEAGELTVYYQPQIDLRAGTVRGVEALVRWRHPRRGFLSPDEFLPAAEQAGLMRSLTRFVLEEALGQCRAWHNAGTPLDVAVNLSGRDLVDTRLPDEVVRALAEHGLDPGVLQLEITEGTLLTESMRGVAVLDRLAANGVRIAIDDFGVGYSALGHLRRLPVSVLKIDKSFVQQMPSEQTDALIVRSTIDLAHSLGLEVVAEGVEEPETLALLEAARCDLAQGYCISRPLPAEDLTTWLAARPLPEPLPAPTELAARVHRLAPRPASDAASA
jgi:diguanylate cyclase (GGDEF)-like protein